MLYPGSGKPLFEQLADTIMHHIQSGIYKQGDALPPEREMAAEFAVSRVTVRQALATLAADGVIIKKQGKGNIITSKKIETQLDNLMGFVEEFAMLELDYIVNAEPKGNVIAPPEVKDALGSFANDSVFLLVRNISIDGMPLGVDYSYFPQSVAVQFDGIDFKNVILMQFFEQRGYKITSANQTLSAEIPSAEEARFLNISTKTPILARTRVAYVEGDLPILFSRSIYRGDRYRYSFTLNRHAPKSDYKEA
jgi:GntR family transcriptional regulator